MDIQIGRMEKGHRNAITDVPGVRVGHCTVDNDRHKTGVTVVMPCEDDIFRNKMVAACHVLPRDQVPPEGEGEQLDLFADGGTGEKFLLTQQKEARELRRQEAVLQIRQKYGKNAILKGMNYLEGATTRQRNGQVGGHRR